MGNSQEDNREGLTETKSVRGRNRERLPSESTRALARRVLPAVDQRLRELYHTADLGNKANPLDELVFIQLSIRTREGTYHRIYDDLKCLVGADWSRLLELTDDEFIQVLHGGGMAAVKVRRLRDQIRAIVAAFGKATLDPLRGMNDRDAEAFLLALHGIGRKAARCVLLYSLGRDVFPVDSHCRRVMARLGLLPDCIDRKEADDYLQELVPPVHRYSLHVNLVHHGRFICVPITPKCSVCALHDLCPTGRSRTSKNAIIE
jgi:endonuclease III